VISGRLEGTVRDQAGAPFAGAIVSIVGTELSSTTNAQGHYVLMDVPVGTYSLRVAFIGYRPSLVEGVTIMSDQTVTQDVTIDDPAVSMDEIIVVTTSYSGFDRARRMFELGPQNVPRILTQESWQYKLKRTPRDSSIARDTVDQVPPNQVTPTRSRPTRSAAVNLALQCGQANPGVIRGVLVGLYTPEEGSPVQSDWKNARIGVVAESIEDGPLHPGALTWKLAPMGYFSLKVGRYSWWDEVDLISIAVDEERLDESWPVVIDLPMEDAEADCIITAIPLSRLD
jgi:hypothetical protein